MPKPILTISADTHVSKTTWNKYKDLHSDSYYGLGQLVDRCKQHETDLVLAGDVFDKTRPDPLSIFETRRILNELPLNRKLYFIQGQHERNREMTWLNAISDNFIHLHNRLVNISGLAFYGIDWTPGLLILDEINKIPSTCEVLVMHQVWRDFMGDGVVLYECEFSDIPYGDMLITGDYHKHIKTIIHRKDGNEMLALSPGSTCIQSINEHNEKKFFVLYDDMSVESFPLKTRNVYRFVINTNEELTMLLDNGFDKYLEPQKGVPQPISKNIIRISCMATVEKAHHLISEKIANNAFLFFDTFYNESFQMGNKIINVTGIDLNEDDVINSCLKTVIDDPITRSELMALINSADKEAVLEELKTKYIKKLQT